MKADRSVTCSRTHWLGSLTCVGSASLRSVALSAWRALVMKVFGQQTTLGQGHKKYLQLWHAKCLIIGVRTRLVLFCLMSELTIKTQTSKYHTGTISRRERRCSVSSFLYVSTVTNGSWGCLSCPTGGPLANAAPRWRQSRAPPRKKMALF